MANKRVLVLGGSGLVGQELLRLLLEDDHYSEVVSMGRRTLDLTHPKLQQEIVDFDNLGAYAALIEGDAVFCCLGTTMKKAGSEETFRKIDYGYPFAIAQLAKAAQIPAFLIVTAMGADPNSFFFYNRVKGEIERDLAALDFPHLYIARPGLLLGSRQEERWGESMAQTVMQTFSPILPLSYRPISGTTVARALIKMEQTHPAPQVIGSGELQKLGKMK